MSEIEAKIPYLPISNQRDILNVIKSDPKATERPEVQRVRDMILRSLPKEKE